MTGAPVWMMLLLLPVGAIPDRLLKQWARLVVRASGCRLTVTGAAHLRQSAPAVLVSNHASFLDSIALMAVIPLAYRFVVDRRHERWPFVGTAIRKADYITVNRGSVDARAECLRTIIDALQRGESLLLFPEGGRSRRPGLLPFRLGAFRASVEAGRPLIPITVRGTRSIWPPDARLLRRGRIDVIIHAPIEPAGRGRQEIARLRASARREIERGLAIDGQNEQRSRQNGPVIPGCVARAPRQRTQPP